MTNKLNCPETVVTICFAMGPCLGKAKKGGDNGVIEHSSVTNDNFHKTGAKVGQSGANTKVAMNTSTNCYSISGDGTVLGSCHLDCDTGYWEVVVGKNPEGLNIGVKRFNPKKPVSLDGYIDGKSNDTSAPSWCLDKSMVDLKEGDVVGICWDQTDLPMVSFSVNGEYNPMRGSINRIRPANDVCPAVSVTNGATCELIFDGRQFKKSPPSSKFTMIVCATSLI